MSRRNNRFDLQSKRRKRYDLFISHSWSYSKEYERFEEKLEEANHFKYRNYSVTEKKKIEDKTTRGLERHIKHRQIKHASVVLVLAGMYASSAHSRWIQKEIRFANELDKNIIGVRPWGNKRVPSEVRNNAVEVVGWNTNSIVDAIRRHSP